MGSPGQGGVKPLVLLPLQKMVKEESIGLGEWKLGDRQLPSQEWHVELWEQGRGLLSLHKKDTAGGWNEEKTIRSIGEGVPSKRSSKCKGPGVGMSFVLGWPKVHLGFSIVVFGFYSD